MGSQNIGRKVLMKLFADTKYEVELIINTL
jgi:hypothetical protein